MSFKPNTVQVPRDIVKGVADKKFHPYDVYYAALRVMYPKVDPAELAEDFSIDYPDKVNRYFEQGAPSGGGGGQKNYPEAPPAEEGFLKWLQDLVEEETPNLREIKESVANAIFDKAGGDYELVEDAVILMADYHNNGEEVQSPGAVILNTLNKREPSQIREDADKVRNGGTVVGNRERRMSRALERTEEYARAKEEGPDKEFLGDED